MRTDLLPSLRQAMNGLDAPRSIAADPISFGVVTIDNAIGGGLERGGLHEIYPAYNDHIGAATGLVAALALRAAGSKQILWVRQELLDTETGALNASGIAELGLDPRRIVLVRARNAENVLGAGEQAARCAALGAVVIEVWGEPKILDFTASRRLSLAAAKSAVPVLLLRAAAASSAHSAAATRWSVKAVCSQALAANAPGLPAFELNLLRRRGGGAGRSWRVEWDRDRKCFQDRQRTDVAPLPRPVVSVSSNRSSTAGAQHFEFRRAG